MLLTDSRDALYTTIDELGPPAPRFVATGAAQGGGSDVGEAEVAVYAARLPIARVAGVDEDDAPQVAAEPHGGGEARRTAADDCHVID